MPVGLVLCIGAAVPFAVILLFGVFLAACVSDTLAGGCVGSGMMLPADCYKACCCRWSSRGGGPSLDLQSNLNWINWAELVRQLRRMFIYL